MTFLHLEFYGWATVARRFVGTRWSRRVREGGRLQILPGGAGESIRVPSWLRIERPRSRRRSARLHLRMTLVTSRKRLTQRAMRLWHVQPGCNPWREFMRVAAGSKRRIEHRSASAAELRGCLRRASRCVSTDKKGRSPCGDRPRAREEEMGDARVR